MTSRDIALDRRGDLEVNAPAELRRSSCLRCRDRVLVRIDSEDFLCRACESPGQAAVAAADLKNPLAGEVDDLGEGGELGTCRIDDRRGSVAERHLKLFTRRSA